MKVNYNDPKTYELFQRGDTVGVFQFEAKHARKALQDIQPRNLKEVSDASALLRPGSKDSGQTQLYIDRKSGIKPIEYLHPELESVLSDTYGVFVYQEQIIKAAQVLADWDASTADILRYCIGKKDKQKMKQMIDKFVRDCKQKGIHIDIINQVVEVFKASSKYSFNKSHSIAYSMISYQTAYMKVHYPVDFYYGNIIVSDNQMNQQKYFQTLYYDAIKHHVAVRFPQFGEFQVKSYIKNNEIVLGLHLVKSIQFSELQLIADLLNQNKNIDNVIIDLRKNNISRRSVLPILASGMCDIFLESPEQRFKYLTLAEAMYLIQIKSFIAKLEETSLFSNDSDIYLSIIEKLKVDSITYNKCKELYNNAIKKRRPKHYNALKEAEYLGVVFSALPDNHFVMFDESEIYNYNGRGWIYNLLNHNDCVFKYTHNRIEDRQGLINIEDLQ